MPGKVRLHFFFVKLTQSPPNVATSPLPTAKFKIVLTSATPSAS